MRDGSKRPFRMLLPLALALPLLAVAGAAFVAFSDDAGDGTAVALGAQGGAFHPVAGGFVPDESALEDCGESYTCLQQAFGNVAYRQGPKRALALFEEQIERDDRVRQDCHRIAHAIGSAAFARFDDDVARTFSVGSSICASGYYHGVLERAFIGVNTRKRLVAVARDLCVAPGIRPRGFLDYQCRHGLGHGLMIQSGYDLPLALSTCAQLENGWDDLVCAGGVFMENVNTAFGYRSRWVEDDDPTYPCDEVRAEFQRSCYRRASFRVLDAHGGDWTKAASACRVLGAELARFCFQGLGRDAVSRAQRAPRDILSSCGRVTGGQAECLFGAARTIGDTLAVEGTKRAARLCRRARTEWRERCFGGVGVVVGLLYPTHDARQRACGSLAGRLVDSCSRGAVREVHPRGEETWA